MVTRPFFFEPALERIIIYHLSSSLLQKIFSLLTNKFTYDKITIEKRVAACGSPSIMWKITPSTSQGRRSNFLLLKHLKLLFLAAVIGDNRYYQQTECKNTTQCLKSNHIITPLQGKPSIAVITICCNSHTYSTISYIYRQYKAYANA